MNKADIVDQVAEDVKITKVQATAVLECIMESLTKAMKKGEKITLVGFGTFSVTKRAARKGRNPATGESIRIKAKKVVKFKGSNELHAKL